MASQGLRIRIGGFLSLRCHDTFRVGRLEDATFADDKESVIGMNPMTLSSTISLQHLGQRCTVKSRSREGALRARMGRGGPGEQVAGLPPFKTIGVPCGKELRDGENGVSSTGPSSGCATGLNCLQHTCSVSPPREVYPVISTVWGRGDS
jgi:hypothetical protein